MRTAATFLSLAVLLPACTPRVSEQRAPALGERCEASVRGIRVQPDPLLRAKIGDRIEREGLRELFLDLGELEGEGIRVRLVSMPCLDRFAEQRGRPISQLIGRTTADIGRVAAAQAVYDNAQRDFARRQTLVGPGAISRDLWEQTRADRDRARRDDAGGGGRSTTMARARAAR